MVLQKRFKSVFIDVTNDMKEISCEQASEMLCKAHMFYLHLMEIELLNFTSFFACIHLTILFHYDVTV